MNDDAAQRRKDRMQKNNAYLINWNKKNRTVKTYDREFIPRKRDKGPFVPDLLDRPTKG